MNCPRCGTNLTVGEFYSMGPGYREFESYVEGELVISCPNCHFQLDQKTLEENVNISPCLTCKDPCTSEQGCVAYQQYQRVVEKQVAFLEQRMSVIK